MNRNVTILVIILVILLIAGYLLWLRGRFQVTEVQQTPAVVEVTTPTAAPTIASASATATPSGKASPAVKASPTPKTSTTSGKTVR